MLTEREAPDNLVEPYFGYFKKKRGFCLVSRYSEVEFCKEISLVFWKLKNQSSFLVSYLA